MDTLPSPPESAPDASGVGYYTLPGDINSEMVRRVFDATARMTQEGIRTAHILLQSHGGFISDGICIYNFWRNVPIEIVTYNAGAVASIAVVVFLAGKHRLASGTGRFMIHKSHASPGPGARPDALRIIAEGLLADDRRTESIIREHVTLSTAIWDVHAQGDVHLTAAEALAAGLIHEIGHFAPPFGARIMNI